MLAAKKAKRDFSLHRAGGARAGAGGPSERQNEFACRNPAIFRVRVLTFLRGTGDSNVSAAKPKNKKPASKIRNGLFTEHGSRVT